MQMNSKNKKDLENFVKYCKKHPGSRFWQAIYSWLKIGRIYVDGKDPYYWKKAKGD